MLDQTGGDGVDKVSEGVFRWKFAEAEFDEARWELLVVGTPVRLERKPLEVLACLLRHAGEVVTKDELLDSAWAGRIVVEAALTNAIGKLRLALKDSDQSLIVTVPRVGYRLMGKVERKSISRLAPPSQLRQGDAVPRRPNWKLTRALDQSERGEVWLSEHAKTHESRVFKFSFDGGQLGSLKREATISRLLHDSLGDRADFVRVIDWDFEDAPYFIESEYGGPDLEQCAVVNGGLASIPLHERIAWLAETADAVAAAHEVGVLHKDLKPANVLVRGEPGDWHPRLVDFGSGRVLDPARLEALGITRLGLTQTQSVSTGSLTGTPLYLAPELLSGQVPTVRSDIYALGVMLFQLCVGDLRRPLSAGWEEEISDPLLREDIASAANGNPELRFASARVFAERLRTREERQQARVDEEALRENVARNERALAATRSRRPWLITAFALLVLGLGTTYWMYRQVASANASAQHQARVAQAVNQFLNHDLLAAANPLNGGRVDVSVRDALDQAAPNIDTRFAGDASSAATVHLTAGDAYYQLSEFKSAQTQFTRALDLFSKSDGQGSAEAVLSKVRLANALVRSGDLEQGRVTLDEAAADVARLSASFPMLRVNNDLARGWLAFGSLKFEDVIPPLEDAVQALAGIPDADPDVTLTVQQALTSARSRMGFPTETLEETQRRVLAKLENQKGHSAPLTLGARHLLARIEVLRGKGREMEQTYIDLVKDFSRVLGPENENTLLTVHGLANVYSKLERWKDAERFSRQAWDGLGRQLGPHHINTLNALNSYALAEFKLGKLDQAGDLYEDGIQQVRTNGGKLSGLLLTAFQLNLAHVRIAQGRMDDAAVLIADIRANGGTLVEKDTDAAGELAYLDGRIKLAKGDEAGAQTELRAAIELLGKTNPSDYWIIQEANAALRQSESSQQRTNTKESL